MSRKPCFDTLDLDRCSLARSLQSQNVAHKREEDLADRPDASSARPPGASKEPEEEEERGRTIDKGKARVKVVGFDGDNPDNVDENECASF